jgi:hypothetical protein
MGVQYVVDGVAIAVPAETAHNNTVASATRLMLRSRVEGFIVPSLGE